MAPVDVANSVLSNLFRICSFIFLRVIPVRHGKYVLPTLYLSYLASWLFLPPPSVLEVKVEEKPVKTEQEKTEKAEQNGTTPQENGTTTEENGTKPLPSPLGTVPAVVVVPQEPSALNSILLGLPTPIKRQRLLNLAINTLFLLGAVDLTFRPYFDAATDVTFTRVGAVYPDAAKIVVRYPAVQAKATVTSMENATEPIPADTLDERLNEVRIQWRQFPATAAAETASWKDGPILSLKAESDWISTAKLSGLYPSTIYEYRLASLDRSVLPYPVMPIVFRTFPDPRYNTGSHFRFIATSCTTPNFPYVPFNGRTIKGFDLLASYLWPRKSVVAKAKEHVKEPLDEASQLVDEMLHELKSSAEAASSSVASEAADTEEATEVPTSTSTPAPSATPELVEPPPVAEFLLFLGDFIYADVPWYFGDDKEAYRRLYRRNYNSPSFRRVYEQLPVFHVYDDHEVINNFAGQGNATAAPFPNASDAYTLYNHQANYDSSSSSVVKGDKTYYDFRYADVAFFVMDTRLYRSDPDFEDPAAKTMLGDEQLTALYDWLGKVNGTATFKFIVTSVPFTSLWTHDAQTDSWAGYAAEKAALLRTLHTVPNVILLSGDRHEFAAIQFNGDDESAQPVVEFSTSPLSMFYIPLIRTLKQKSEAVVRRVKQVVIAVEEDAEPEIVDEVEEIPQEVVLKYIPTGNYKWSTFEVDTRDMEHPVVRMEMIADGRRVYRMEIKGKPVKLGWSTAIGAFVPESFRGVLDKIGLKPSKWF